MSRKTTSLYHPFFTEEERRDLEGIPHDDLTGEIFLQRYLLVMVMSKSPPGSLDFDLLLEKTRACNIAIRSLLSLINTHMQLRKGRKQAEWEQFFDAAHLLAVEELGILDQAFPVETAEAIRSNNPYYRRHMEMEASFDTPGEPTLPAESPKVGRDSIPPNQPDVGQDSLP
jgi:hypothetical protein